MQALRPHRRDCRVSRDGRRDAGLRGGGRWLFCYGVIARYILNDPSDVAGEVAIILYLWSIMIGGSLAVALHDHISFDLLVHRLAPPQAARIVEAVGAADRRRNPALRAADHD